MKNHISIGYQVKPLNFLHKMRLPPEILQKVTKYLDLLKAISLLGLEGWEEGKNSCASKMLWGAAICGYLDMVKWIHWHKPYIIRSLIDPAAFGGHLEVVKWLHSKGYSCTENAMDWAAESGHLDVVKWLYENRTEGCTTYAMDWAAKKGHLDVVKWLHENRIEGCTTRAMGTVVNYFASSQ